MLHNEATQFAGTISQRVSDQRLASGNLGLQKSETLLRVSALSVDYDSASGDVVHALRNVDLEIGAGRSLGVLGASGSGKSTLALALLRLLPSSAGIVSGKVEFQRQNLTELSPKQLRAVRGGEMALISQEPALALNPALTLGTQIRDVLQAHSTLNQEQISLSCKEMLREVGFAEPERILRAYPHELSGGQRQRVAIAQALICRPKLLIADEPLSALDVATQADILELLQRLKRDLGLALFFITHNAGVLSSLTERAVVMRDGEIVARGSMEDLQRSSDPYLEGILFPEKMIARSGSQAKTINSHDQPLLEVRDVSKRFVQRRMLSRKKFMVQSLDGVSFSLPAGSTVAVLGRSGSGKSTLARCIAGFETPDSGAIAFQGKSGPLQRQVQMVFQDAATSLNPRFTARQVITEPMEIAREGNDLERTARVLVLMQEVGLDPDWAGRLAGEFSGGQRQRLALARALAGNPKLLVMDEAFSGLDLPLQAQMMRLLMDIQAKHGLTYLYISHDLNFVSLFAQEIMVMEAGKIVERLAATELARAAHPATRELVQASERLHAIRAEAAV
ncbi:MAG TPA: ABC transporter ATP-binding protein [Candidatus Angelobacter sp.]|nr:ABC transporter ATP-binding protein [Candidatus Angelobacter sp.]